MVVQLNLLESVSYNELADVFLSLDEDSYELVGGCSVAKVGEREYIGVLNFDEEVSQDLYVKYLYHRKPNGVLCFNGIALLEDQNDDQPMEQLKDIMTTDWKISN
jgi:hypothetical protein